MNKLYAIVVLLFSFVFFLPSHYFIEAQNRPVIQKYVPNTKSSVSGIIASPRAGFGQKPSGISENTSSIYAYVVKESEIYGIPIASTTFIVSHESQWNPEKLGDDDQSRGLWQISRIWHPEVSDKCAMDTICSTQWSLQFIAANKNNINQWSTYRLCKKLYGVCPQ